MIRAAFAAVVLLAGSAAASAPPAPGTARAAGDTDAVAWAAYQRIHSDFFDLDKTVKSDPREIELGRQLFFDPRLSGNGAMSCATCHDPSRAWGDALPRGRGLGQKELARNTPSLLTVHRNIPHPFFWDGRADSIEKAILTALQSRLEMDRDPRLLVVDLSRVPAYNEAFRLLYGPEGISPDRLARAIGAFIKAEIAPGDTPFDRYRTDPAAMTPAAKRGMDLFAGKARCLLCHTGAFFSDDFFHNVGLRPTPGLEDAGRGALVKDKHSFRAFHTPPLRDVTRTGPYMHDGRDKDLASVIEFYNRGGDVHDESQDDLVKPLGLTAVERADLLAFLQALTSPDRETRFPVLPPARGPRSAAEGYAFARARVDAAAAALRAGRKDLAWAQAASLLELVPAWKRVGGGACVDGVERAASSLQQAADGAGDAAALARRAGSAVESCRPATAPEAATSAVPGAGAPAPGGFAQTDAEIAEATSLLSAAEAEAAGKGAVPGLAENFTVPKFVAEIAAGRWGPRTTDILLQAVRFDVLRYYEYKAFLADDPAVCLELKISKIYFGIERTGDWACRERHFENVLSHAFLTRPPDFVARCEKSFGISYPQLEGKDTAAACRVIADHFDAPGPCGDLIPDYLVEDKRESCENFFARFRTAEDPASCDPLSSGPTQWRERCKAYSAFQRARKSGDWKQCEGRGLCLSFLGRREGLDEAAAKIKSLMLETLARSWFEDLASRLERARLLVTGARARLAALEATRGAFDLVRAAELDAREEKLARLDGRIEALRALPQPGPGAQPGSGDKTPAP